jgi:hypothetical protein
MTPPEDVVNVKLAVDWSIRQPGIAETSALIRVNRVDTPLVPGLIHSAIVNSCGMSEIANFTQPAPVSRSPEPRWAGLM